MNKLAAASALLLLLTACTSVGQDDAAVPETLPEEPSATAAQSDPSADASAETVDPAPADSPVATEVPPHRNPVESSGTEETTSAGESAQSTGSAPPEPSAPLDASVVPPQAGPTEGTVSLGSPLTLYLAEGENTTASTEITAVLTDNAYEPWRWVFSAPDSDNPDPGWQFTSDTTVSEVFTWTLAPGENDVTFTVVATAHAFRLGINEGTSGSVDVLVTRNSPVTP